MCRWTIGHPRNAVATANLDANTVSVFLNGGDGTFLPKLDLRAGGDPRLVAIGDLNGDGKPDLVAANNDANAVSLFLNKGGGTFRSGATTQPDRAPYRSRSAT
jgi:hypothetical protein